MDAQSASAASEHVNLADLIRGAERERLRALVAADVDAAHRFHADDFQLITPGGDVLTKSRYLGGIASGYLNYHLWEPDSEIDVRLSGDSAMIRYRSRLHVSLDGAEGEPRQYWHTDLYELRDGSWQVACDQTTAIA